MLETLERGTLLAVWHRWVRFQAIAERRRSIVDTELAFTPRSAVPEAQAVM